MMVSQSLMGRHKQTGHDVTITITSESAIYNEARMVEFGRLSKIVLMDPPEEYAKMNYAGFQPVFKMFLRDPEAAMNIISDK